MTRFPLTTEGVAAFCAKVYKYDDSRLQSTAGEAAADPRAFLASRFELLVEQLEFIRGLDAAFMQIFGWGLATALLGRMPISYRPVVDILKEGQKNAYAMITSQLRGHCSGTSITVEGRLAFLFGFGTRSSAQSLSLT
ncbi:hypothetical protein AAEO56_16820 [Flavobacterium sp. DGU11]|uniref:Uncharacterized protein n=1 Tax=Flavobacterium arundinis TaxID=3139143 RepID=A0ABU9I0I5_9FLAO